MIFLNINEINKQKHLKRKIAKEYQMGKKYFVETSINKRDFDQRMENHHPLDAFLEVSEEFNPKINNSIFNNSRKK